MFKSQFCTGCPRRCVEACTHDAIRAVVAGNPLVMIDRSLCVGCRSYTCLRSCYTGALQLSGKWYSVDEMMTVIRRDRQYWGHKGGVSLTGGEPLVQVEFAAALLRRCHEAYIHTCVETCAHVARGSLEAVLPLIDWLFVDLKHMDPDRHRAGTGSDNKMILENIQWLARSGWKGRLIVRMPVVPDFNDSVENAQATAGFMNGCGLGEINLLPFHRLGASKYEQLGSEYQFQQTPAVNVADLEPLAHVYRRSGLACYLGSGTPF